MNIRSNRENHNNLDHYITGVMLKTRIKILLWTPSDNHLSYGSTVLCRSLASRVSTRILLDGQSHPPIFKTVIACNLHCQTSPLFKASQVILPSPLASIRRLGTFLLSVRSSWSVYWSSWFFIWVVAFNLPYTKYNSLLYQVHYWPTYLTHWIEKIV